MVAQLAEKTEKADELLNKIARDVQDGKTTTMDPALSAEVKKLLGCVLGGQNSLLSDLQLTSARFAEVCALASTITSRTSAASLRARSAA